MSTYHETVKMTVEIETSCTSQNWNTTEPVDCWTATIYFFGKEIASSDFCTRFSTEKAAIRNAKRNAKAKTWRQF